MVYYFLIVSFILLLVNLVVLVILYKKYNKIQNDIVKTILIIKRLRYGDINLKAENLSDTNLEAYLNRLIETINDRELMIKEYQSNLSKKNLSLEELIKQEKQLQLFKEEFAATLTHDMKVPVIAELNSLNYLLEGRFGNLNEKQIEILKLMKASNQELKDLIENMLETYKLEQKGINVDFTENSINDFLAETIKEMEPIVFSTNHAIVQNIKATNDTVYSFDKFQLKRVIKNLIQNAISFSPESSVIEVRTYKDNNCIKLCVSNKGKSISPNDLDLIFQKYYSGQSKFRKAGTGLGLYLSQQIVLAHNGSIEVDLSKEGYTTFILNLPINISTQICENDKA